jgi:hypothetical protein
MLRRKALRGGRKGLLFLKKKKQKDFWTRFAAANLHPGCNVGREREPPTEKSLFASFSSEKEDSFP